MRFVAAFAVFAWSAIGLQSTAWAEPLSIDQLIVMLSSGEPFESAYAAKSVGANRTDSPSAIDTLVKALSDNRIADRVPAYVPTRRTVASYAADALVTIGKPAVERLAQCAAGNAENRTRSLALRTLSRLGHVAHASAPIIEQLLKDDEYEIRYYAVNTLSSVQPDGRKVVNALRPVLSDESPHVRAEALQSLGRLGNRASICILDVARLLDDQEDRWHHYTPDMIGTRPVRYDAAMTLAEMGKDARVALPKLRKMMIKDSEPLVRIASALAVARLDDDASLALAELICHLEDCESNDEPCEDTMAALAKLGAKAKPAIPSLTRTLENLDVYNQIFAVETIAAIDPNVDAITSLLPLLNDPDYLVRETVIEALGEFGAKASDALPRLRQIVNEGESEFVKEAAEYAIRQITRDR